jgi:hypothetical protein
MTKDQLLISKALGSIRYLPGSFDKRFALNLAHIAEDCQEKELTEKQNEWMYRLLYKYRNQLPQIYLLYQNNPLCTRLRSPKNKIKCQN